MSDRFQRRDHARMHACLGGGGMKHNVLITGTTGVGKSSLVNLLKSDTAAAVSSSADQGTHTIEKYPFRENFMLYDVPAFDNANADNCADILNLLRTFKQEILPQGISLIIYVMKKGRFTKSAKEHYDYFVKEMCQNQVHVLVVVTHCENDSDEPSWYSSQRGPFRTLGIKFDDAICGCATDLSDGNLDDKLMSIHAGKRNRTKASVEQKIEELALRNPWVPARPNGDDLGTTLLLTTAFISAIFAVAVVLDK